MKRFSKWVSALAATVLLAGTSAAADAVSTGKVKSINADKKELVLTDAAGKDWTIKLGDKVIINRDGKESPTDLKAGDPVSVCYDKGLLSWTAHYILVQEGDNKNLNLVRGSVKGYDADKKQVAFTDDQGKEWTFDLGDAKLRLNQEDTKVKNIKIGDHALLIVEKTGDKMALKCLMAKRVK